MRGNIIIFIFKQIRTQLSSISKMLLTQPWARAKSTQPAENAQPSANNGWDKTAATGN